MVVNPIFPKLSIIDWLTDWRITDWLTDDWLTDDWLIDCRFVKSRRVALFENKEKIGTKRKDEGKK